MNAVVALREAADFIEKHPDQYKYTRPRIPINTLGVGCAMAWTAYFAGLREEDTHRLSEYSSDSLLDVMTRKVLGINYWYEDDGIEGFEVFMRKSLGSHEWEYDPAVAARGLRALADKMDDKRVTT